MAKIRQIILISGQMEDKIHPCHCPGQIWGFATYL
jgi:hypothetical protein